MHRIFRIRYAEIQGVTVWVILKKNSISTYARLLTGGNSGCYCLSHFEEKFYINVCPLINRWIATSTSRLKTLYSIHSHETYSSLLPLLVNTTPSCLAFAFVHRRHQILRPFIISRGDIWKRCPQTKMSGQRRNLAVNNGGRWLHKGKW